MKLKFLQEGGAMDAPVENPNVAPEGGAPEGGAEQDPIMMLAQMAAQALQNNDAQLALQVCQGFLELVQQMAGEASGAGTEPQGEPVYRKGGKLAYIAKN